MPTAPFTVFAFTIFALLATAARAQGQAAKLMVHSGTILFKRHPSLMVQHESNITVGDDSFGCNFDGPNADCSSNYIQGFDELPVVTLEDGDDLLKSSSTTL
jgi:hypothetical protein